MPWTAVIRSVLVAQAAALPCAPPVISDATVPLWAPNLVDVRGGVGDAGREDSSGVGFVVGWRSGEAWIAVPAHVLYRGDEPPAAMEALLRTRLEIRFGQQDAARELCPSRGGLSNPVFASLTADVAFVCVQWNHDPLPWSAVTAGSFDTGVDVQLRGPSPGFTRTGRLLSIDVEGPDQFVTASVTGEQGMSGAPIVSPAGVVGFYLGKHGTARGVAVATVRRLALTAQVPWNLVDAEFYDCRRTARICLQADDGIAPRALTATAGDGRTVVLPLTECRDVPEGRYVLTDASRQFVCEPMVLLVTRRGAEVPAVRVSCEPELGGTWISRDGRLRLDCVAAGTSVMRQVRCAGLQGVGLGMLAANVNRDGDRLAMVGSFSDPSGAARPVTGDLAWTPEALSGTLQVPGFGPIPIDLERRVP